MDSNSFQSIILLGRNPLDCTLENRVSCLSFLNLWECVWEGVLGSGFNSLLVLAFLDYEGWLGEAVFSLHLGAILE